MIIWVAFALSVCSMVMAVASVVFGILTERRRRAAITVQEAFKMAGVDYEAAQQGEFRPFAEWLNDHPDRPHRDDPPAGRLDEGGSNGRC
jgi:hypothetical protein